jgi:hypothetical protein
VWTEDSRYEQNLTSESWFRLRFRSVEIILSWRRLSTGLLRRVDSSRWAVALMMEAGRISETSVKFYRPHGATTQKTVIFILTAVRTSNLTNFKLAFIFYSRGIFSDKSRFPFNSGYLLGTFTVHVCRPHTRKWGCDRLNPCHEENWGSMSRL